VAGQSRDNSVGAYQTSWSTTNSCSPPEAGAQVRILPGADVGTLDMAYQPPAIERAGLRRRPLGDRAAA
jgi:hypothetical protein